MLAATGLALDAVVVLAADQDELVSRLLQRAHTEGRADYTEEVIRRRQEIYTAATAPLITVSVARGVVNEVDGLGETDAVTTRIFDAIGKRSRRDRVWKYG